MLADDTDDALVWGGHALELAIRLGDERVRIHALVNIGSAQIQLDDRDSATLLEAIQIADLREERHEAARALSNLAYSMLVWVRPEPALRYAEQGLAYARAHEVHTLAPYLATIIAWLKLRAGDWDEAERIVRARAGARGDRASAARDAPCSPTWRSAAATRTRPSGWPTSPSTPIAPASRSGSCRRSSWRANGR